MEKNRQLKKKKQKNRPEMQKKSGGQTQNAQSLKKFAL
jgi:hypothetical protein